jgi:hypothetical protein
MDAKVSSEQLEETRRSPLWMVTKKPCLNEFVGGLESLREELSTHKMDARQITFSLKHLLQVKQEFSDMIREGESILHRLCQFLSHTLLQSVEMQSVVIGEVQSIHHRFTLVQPIAEQQLLQATDLDIGTQQLLNFRFFNGTDWEIPLLVSNVIEYHSTQQNEFGIHRLISRVKAEEEIWNKVVDELFRIDELVKRDKQLLHMSRFVKDVFGVKIVVGNNKEAVRLQDMLVRLTWGEDLGQQIQFIETKEYLDTAGKQSGWQAIKSVVHWRGATIEIQIQTLSNFLSEKQRLTRESHQGFKARRELLRDKIAAGMPLFGFYRSLLKWLFLQTGLTSSRFVDPVFPDIEVILVD